jgi:hypothetical protein
MVENERGIGSSLGILNLYLVVAINSVHVRVWVQAGRLSELIRRITTGQAMADKQDVA